MNALLAGVLFLATTPTPLPPVSGPPPDAATLRAHLTRFAPVELTADLGSLGTNDRRSLSRIIAAARLMDALYLRQNWAGNEALLLKLAEDESPLGKLRLHAFILNKGPWDPLEHDAPIVYGVPPKPDAANFYPPGATKSEVEAFIQTLAEPQKSLATGFYSTLRRKPDGAFTVVPFSVEYQGELGRVSALLREASALTQDASLKSFLSKRADAFASNDFFASELAWMELDSVIEPTLGAYEVYEDRWFNRKASFEAFIGLRDAEATSKLARFSSALQDVENHLPLDAKYRNPKLGALAPIRVVNLLFAAGDANKGVKTAAYNLPNDERITAEKGTKRVMLKNVQEAKFQKVLVPISRQVLSAADQKNVAFDAFFLHILMHELMHGLGPHTLQLHGQRTTVREQLQETSSAIEEAKADITGLFAMQYFIDQGLLEKSLERTLYTTYLASCFRTLRFGATEAHAQGIALQLNYLRDAGAVTVTPDGRYAVVPTKIRAGVEKLTHELLTLEAEGNRARAVELLGTLGVVRPETQKLLARFTQVPVDIELHFLTAEKLLAEQP